MRKLFTLSFLLLAGSSLSAQWTYNASDFPIIGDTAFYRIADTVGVTPGGTGATTYAFGSLTPTGSTVIARYKSPTALPSGGTFPTATVAYAPSNTDFEHYRNSADSSILLGEKSSLGTLINYTDPLYSLKFPFDFNDVIVDSIKAIYPDGIFSNVDRKGEVTTIYDGHGDLTSPTTSYGNIIRIHRIWSYTDSSLSGLATGYTTAHEYLYFEQGQKLPVVKIWDQLTDLNATPQWTHEVWYQDAFPAGVNSASNNERIAVSTYPNPAAEIVNVKYLIGATSPVTIEIYSMEGKVIRTMDRGTQPPGTYEISENVSDLAPGIYTVKVVAGENKISRNFVVE
jgi:Secretion system C-terminal sorting domain